MALFSKSLLLQLRVHPVGFGELYQQLRNKAVATNQHAWKALQRQLGKEEHSASTMLLVKQLFKLLSPPASDVVPAARTPSDADEGVRPRGSMAAAVSNEDGLHHCCANLSTLHSMGEGWSLSGGTLMKGVLMSIQLQQIAADEPHIPRGRLQLLLKCCRTLEWTSRDCFLVMKKATALGLNSLRTQLSVELRDRFQWPDWLFVMLTPRPVAPIEKLHLARNWFVTQKDPYMAFHVRRLIALANRYRVRVYCLCRTQSFDDGCLWIACDYCGSWYHSACVGITETRQELEGKEWTCPVACTHVPSVPEDSQVAVAAIKSPAEAIPVIATTPVQTGRKRRVPQPISYCDASDGTDSEDEVESESEQEDEEQDGSEGNFSDAVSIEEDEDSESDNLADFAEALDLFEHEWVPATHAQEELALESKPPSERRAARAQLKHRMEQQHEQDDDSDWSEGADDLHSDRSEYTAVSSGEDNGDDDDSERDCAPDSSDDSQDDAFEASTSVTYCKRKRQTKATMPPINNAKRPCLDDLRTLPVMPPAGRTSSNVQHSGVSCMTAKCQSNHHHAVELSAPLHASLAKQFVTEMCTIERGHATSAAYVYRHYQSWHRRSIDKAGHKSMGKKVFWRAMDAHFCKSKTDGSMMYRGIACD